MRAWILGAVTAALSSTLLAALAAPAPRRGAPTMILRPASPDALNQIEVTTSNPGQTTARRQPITDLRVRLMPASGEGPISSVLAQPAADRTQRVRILFNAELILVTQGRLLIEERATCGPWSGDASLCQTECDGGAFAIVRQRSPAGLMLQLHLGRLPAISGAGFSEATRIGACRETADEVALAPARSADMAAIPLRQD